MPPSLRALLSGDPPAVLTLHLTEVPLVEPYSLADLTEPTWEGYTPAELQLSQQSASSSGWGWIEGSGGFTYLAEATPPPLSGLFVVATFEGARSLVCVIDLADSENRNLEKGQTTFTVRVNIYEESQG